jgi:hypothetical protein
MQRSGAAYRYSGCPQQAPTGFNLIAPGVFLLRKRPQRQHGRRQKMPLSRRLVYRWLKNRQQAER